MYAFHRRLDGIDFYAPSTQEYKKYDAIVNGKKYSFGDVRYSQFRDKIGYYMNKNNNNIVKKHLYHARHWKDEIQEYSPGYFSMKYLW
jgi:uncharacterized protein YutD